MREEQHRQRTAERERLHGCGAVTMECVSGEMMGMLLDMAPPQKLEGKGLMQSGFACKETVGWQTREMAFWSGSGGRTPTRRLWD